MTELILHAPLSGWLTSVTDAPDPVFAERMLGDGAGIDPTDTVLRAPCDGVIVAVARTCHCVTLEVASGLQILMHVGIDTVAMEGRGFSLRTRQGRTVSAGEALISFDMDLLARQAKSLFTPIVVTHGEGWEIFGREAHRLVQVGEFIMGLRRVDLGATEMPVVEGGEDVEVRNWVIVPMAHGLHARPAAVLARHAKGYRSRITIRAGDRLADARSASAVMSLGVRRGDRIEVVARGVDSAEAVATLVDAIAVGERSANVVKANVVNLVPAAPPPQDDDWPLLRGITAAPGLAVGQIVKWVTEDPVVAEPGIGQAFETKALETALAEVRDDLRALIDSGSEQQGSIMAAHVELLEDVELLQSAKALIHGGKSAGYAWRQAVRDQVAVLDEIGDVHLAARAADYVDLERQVLRRLSREQNALACPLPTGAIVIADELFPSHMATLADAKIGGFCTSAGGPTSHAAILAAAMNIPALVACGPRLFDIQDGTTVILNADEHWLHAEPNTAAIEAVTATLEKRHRLRATANRAARQEARTLDGIRIEVRANISAVEEAAMAVAAGAEGCGLLRTEFLFIHRLQAPSLQEQTEKYQAIASAFGERPLVIRTLDIGGDKPAPYLQLPAEENPALGLRGIRIRMWCKGLFQTQLQAILNVRPLGQCAVLIPMVVSLEELKAARRTLDAVCRELGRDSDVSLGVMIETPAAALLADRIAEHADFLSIGTNDLTQYTLAMDRANTHLAAYIDGLHPAVLRSIANITQAANKHAKPVAVCGALAADTVGAALLIGYGVTELSVPPARIAITKALVRTLTMDACRQVANEALIQDDAGAVRELVSRRLHQIDDCG